MQQLDSIIATPPVDLYALSDLVDVAGADIVEVGSWIGHSAMFLASRHQDARIHCVDTWEGSPNDVTAAAKLCGRERLLRMFCQNVEAYLNIQIFPYVGTSLFWASVWPRSVDLVFIDANHDYEDVLADIRAWTPHVRQGGIICGHDYCESFPGVMRAVKETGDFKTAGERVWWRQC